MNRKLVFWIILSSIFLGLAIAFLAYSHWGRTLIYYDEHKMAPGLGEKFVDKAGKFLLVNREDKTDTNLIDEGELTKFDVNLYDVNYIPAHTAMEYVVGYFQDWEDIQDTNDKYIVLNLGDDIVVRYRLVLDENITKKLRESMIMVENTGVIKPKKPKITKVVNRRLSALGFNKIKSLIKSGDVIAILPKTTNYTTLSKDSNGHTLIDFVVLRRSFGYYEVYNQLLF